MNKTAIYVQKPSEEMQEKIERAIEAISSQKQRVLLCPYCKHKVFSVYEDTRGHVETKCSKCGRITTFDVMNMRHLKPNP